MTEAGNRKRTDKFLFHKNFNTGHFTEVHFFSLSLFPLLVSLPSPGLNVPGVTQQHTVPAGGNKAQASQGSPRVPLVLSSSSTLSCFFPPTLLCCVCVRSTAGGRWWSGCLQGEVALLSTVVLTSTETCQAHSLGLGQGQTLQERWVLQKQKSRN